MLVFVWFLDDQAAVELIRIDECCAPYGGVSDATAQRREL